ncbi:MAG: D-alanyl-D-alanine carboxypeptidase family protein, partial [Micromonosporaceae bacterium]
GAYQTHAATPSGLDGPGQFSSAYDLALIARACFAREDFQRYTASKRAWLPAQKSKGVKKYQIQNDNQLLYEYPGAIGGKTGFTDLARHTYVGAAQRHGRRLVVTVLGAENRPKLGWQQGAALLDWGFAQPADASVGRLVERGELERAKASASRAAARAGLRSAAPVQAAGNSWPPATGLVVSAAVLAVGGIAALLLAAVRRRGRRDVR